MDIPLYFYLAYKDLDRLSPTGTDTTLKVLELIDFENDKLAILDIGCGVGDKTILLAHYFENSCVEAVDLFKHNLAVLNEKITENNLEERVFTYKMNLNDLDFANEEFNIVFSDGAAEKIGFKRALKEWKRLLKKDSYLIISDVSWLKNPSNESKKFWKTIYDDVAMIDEKIRQIGDEGYVFIDYVVTPKSDWKEYYSKLEKNINSLSSDESARNFVKLIRKEIKTFQENSDDYSYVFYIMKVID